MAFFDPTVGLGTTEQIGGRTHGLGDDELKASLIGQLQDLATPAGWWACILRSNGEMHYRRYPQWRIPPGEEIRLFARDLCVALNREMDFGGAWIVGVFENNRRISYFWKDQDGDPHVVVDIEEPPERFRTVGMDHWLEDAHAAWKKMQLQFLAALDLRPEEMANYAKGERLPPSNELVSIGGRLI